MSWAEMGPDVISFYRTVNCFTTNRLTANTVGYFIPVRMTLINFVLVLQT